MVTAVTSSQWLVVLGTLGGATIGVLGTLLATVLRDYTPSSKRRWDDDVNGQ
jgi:hypothetical protein